MTSYVEQYTPSGVNVYGSGSNASTPEPPSPLRWRTFKLPKDDPDEATWIGWEAVLDDTRGGYAQYGDFGRGGNQYDGDYRKTSISTLDQRFNRHLLLSPFITNTAFGFEANRSAAFYTHFGDLQKFVMAVYGNGGTSNLMTETSATNPLLVTSGYSPGAPVVSLAPIIIGGASNAERLAIGREGAVTDVHTTVGTSDGTMNAATSSMWALQTVPINATTPGTGTLLIYAGAGSASIYTLAQTAAIGAAPTAVLQNLPSGGSGLGVEQLQKNWPLRVWWLIPQAGGNTASFAGQGMLASKVMSTNLEGTDPQPISTSLSRVYQAALWDQKMVQTDSARVVAYDGEREADLHFLRNRAGNSDYRWTCSGLIVNGRDLLAFVQRDDLTLAGGVTTPGNTTLRIEQYFPDFDSWVPVTGDYTIPKIAAVGSSNQAPFGSPLITKGNAAFYVLSRQTSHLHTYMLDNSFSRVFLPPGGVNPYYHYNLTGTTQYISQKWATTGTWDSPYFSLPTLEGREKKVNQIVFGGQIAEGTVKVTINPNQGGSSVTFAGTDTVNSQPVDSSDATFDLLQIRIQLNQGSSTFKTPQGLPIIIRGRARLSDPVEELASDYI